MRKTTLALVASASAVIAGSIALAVIAGSGARDRLPLDHGRPDVRDHRNAPEDLSWSPESGFVPGANGKETAERGDGSRKESGTIPGIPGGAPQTGNHPGLPGQTATGGASTGSIPEPGQLLPGSGQPDAPSLIAAGLIPLLTTPDRGAGFVVKAVSALSGEPLRGATVGISSSEMDLSAATGPEGMVGIAIREPFVAELGVSAAGFNPFSAVLDSKALPRDRIFVAQLQPRAYAFPRWVMITDSESGSPLAGVLLRLNDSRGQAFASTGKDGRVALPLEALKLPIHVQATIAGYMDARFTAHDRAGMDVFEFRMIRERVLEVVFVSPAGHTVPGVKASLLASGEGWSGGTIEAVSGQDGVARFPGTAAGSSTVFTITADASGYASSRRTFPAEDALKARIPLRYELPSSIRFEGRLSGHEEWSGNGIVVEYLFPTGSDLSYRPESSQVLSRSAPINADGTFAIEGPGQGAVRIRVRSGQEVLLLSDVTVRTGTRFEISLTDVRRIRITAVDPSGGALAGARVVATRRDEGFERTKIEGAADSSGAFTFHGCAPGTYSGAVNAEGRVETGFDFRVAPEPETTFTAVVKPATGGEDGPK